MTSGDLETGRCLGLHGSPGNAAGISMVIPPKISHYNGE